MKISLQNSFLVASLITASVSIAQPTLTAAGINPVIGDVLIANTTNYLSPGAAGTSQTWNLATFTTSATSTYTAVNPSSTPYASSFTNANVCEATTSYYGYYKTSSTALQIYGNVVSSGTTTTVMPYSNPEDFMHFPFTYTNSYTDTWATTFLSGGYTYYRKGADSTKADGYGTLILPNGTFNNVLRVHFVQNYYDSAYVGMSINITYRNDEYLWYLNGNHYPIAMLSSEVTNMMGNISTNQYGFYLKSAVAGIEQVSTNNLETTIYPNPTTGIINLKSSSFQNINSLEIYNMLGTCIHKQVASPSNGEIDLSTQPNGIYFIHLQTEQGTEIKKLIIEK
ncbi:MAG TPA: T9SS type A sorting domain-containing protein [Bacteroidia bacterium]